MSCSVAELAGRLLDGYFKTIECCLIGCSECVMITDSVNAFVVCIVSLERFGSGPLHFTEVPFHSFGVSVLPSASDLSKTLTSRSRISLPKIPSHQNPRFFHLTVLDLFR